MEKQDYITHVETNIVIESDEFLAADGALSLTEINKKLDLKYGLKNSSIKSLAKKMFAEIDIFMCRKESDWGNEVLVETGLPGTKVVIGEMTIYIHGIAHSLGTRFDKSLGKEKFDEFLRKWVHKTVIDKGEGVVLESGMKRAYQINYGNSVGEDLIVDSLFKRKENITHLFKEFGAALAYEAGSVLLSVIRKDHNQNVKLPEFFRRMVDARKSLEDLIELRKLFFRLPQPFYSLLSEEIAPSSAIERSVVLYRLGLGQMEGHKIVHFISGLDHEPHLVALAKCEGIENNDTRLFTKARIGLAKNKIFDLMAGNNWK